MLCCVPTCCAVQVRIDKFTVEVDPQQLPGGTRYFLVQGEAIERFAQVRGSTAGRQEGLHAVRPAGRTHTPSCALAVSRPGRSAWIGTGVALHEVLHQ